jgi:hypothetical protein
MKNGEQKRGDNRMPLLVHRVSAKQQKGLLAKLDKLEQDYLWISANEKMLKQMYPNKYIAVKGKTVAFNSDNFEALMKVLINLDQEIDSYAIKKVTEKATCLLL